MLISENTSMKYNTIQIYTLSIDVLHKYTVKAIKEFIYLLLSINSVILERVLRSE